MREEVVALFHELADLPPSARSEYYASKQIPPGIRDEVESLLHFDQASDSLTNDLAEAKKSFKRADYPLKGPCGALIA
jgi:hypothetical protein